MALLELDHENVEPKRSDDLLETNVTLMFFAASGNIAAYLQDK